MRVVPKNRQRKIDLRAVADGRRALCCRESDRVVDDFSPVRSARGALTVVAGELNVYTCSLSDPSDGKLQCSVRPHSVNLPDRVHPGRTGTGKARAYARNVCALDFGRGNRAGYSGYPRKFPTVTGAVDGAQCPSYLPSDYVAARRSRRLKM